MAKQGQMNFTLHFEATEISPLKNVRSKNCKFLTEEVQGHLIIHG